ncbi:beta-ketoacyl synthase [Diplogelasinospora grovesii]|uniref:Beta-ketoacyl synthase n=1 Tax=Diplogelasinospora grovesii TaxID=303347 RepID=A0AAN6S155_9PEZI|nr:beta-ketoacyl synthase [Diplogelasinospora grovesii]
MGTERPNGPGHDGPIPIATVGLAFEFPQDATSEESFWEMICEGRSASTEFPPDRLNIDAFYHPDENRPSSLLLRGGHFVKEDLGAFDAPFFSISPDEAAYMDPQHRRLLETHTMLSKTAASPESSGIPVDKCTGSKTSVYTGSFTNDYLSILQQDFDAEQRHAAMGIAPSMLANRLSWFFNFKGTSMNLDTACSSSMVALHLACQDLRTGGCNMVS